MAVQRDSTSALQTSKSVKREELCNTLTEFGISTKLAGLIKMRLNETYSKVCTNGYVIHFLFGMVSNKEMLYCRHSSST
jgi:hypothetical protein